MNLYENQRWNHVLRKGKNFLLRMWHPSWCPLCRIKARNVLVTTTSWPTDITSQWDTTRECQTTTTTKKTPQLPIPVQPPRNHDRVAPLPTGQIDAKNPDENHRSSNTESTATCKHNTQETAGRHCREKDSRRQESQNRHVCHKVAPSRFHQRHARGKGQGRKPS